MIFLNLLNRIFGPKKPLSRQEIDDYKQGRGNLHEVEVKASSSLFDDEALEGWSNIDGSINENMQSSDKKFEEFTHKQSKNNPQNNSGLFLSFALFTIAMIMLIIFTYQGNETFEEHVQIAQEKPEEPSQIDKVDMYNDLPSEKQITANNLIPSVEKKDVENKKKNINVDGSKEKRLLNKQTNSDNNQETIHLPVKPNKELSNSSKDNLIYYNAKEVYLHNLKNVDYRSYRNRPIKTVVNLNIGTPADQASRTKDAETPIVQNKDVPYIDYLTNTAELFSLGKYKLALKRYLTILETYPEDVNANFYGGLCYYNLGQFEKSKKLLRNSFAVGYGNFRQEAMWFGAKANYELHNDIKTRYLLKKIIKEDGFYAKQAKELLGKLK